MNLKTLTDLVLDADTKKLCNTERQITTQVLHHLRENNRRRLFAVMGYSNLIEYCIKELKYSESAAYRRVQAMKLLNELPEIEEKIAEGSLNLNQLAQVQTFFQKSSRELKKVKTVTEKREILTQLESQSSRQTERTLLDLEPSLSLKPLESIKPLSDGKTQVTLTLSQEGGQVLEELKEFYGGRKSSGEIFEIIANDHLERLRKTEQKRSQRLNTAPPAPVPAKWTARDKNGSKSSGTKISRHIPNGVKHQVQLRANRTCEYSSPITQRKCESKIFLEFDHIRDFAKGGLHSPDNLQLLCSKHHRLKTDGLGKNQA